MPRVLLFTSQDIGNDIFAHLHQREDIELIVVTQRTKRDEIYGYRATYDVCLKEGVRVLTPTAFDEAFLSEVEAMKPDLIVCAYYPRIFPMRLIRIPSLGCVNVHPGMLPQYRGTFPTPWCILNNEADIGVTVHLMDAGVDTGDILVQRAFPIGSEETGHELYRRSMKLCADVLIESLDAILAGSLKARPQAPGGSYYNRIDAQYRVDWHLPRQVVLNQVRVHAKPYFPAYSFLFNKCVMFNKISLYDDLSFRAQGVGVIRKVFDDLSFVVSCVDGCVLVEEYELAPLTSPDDIKLHIRAGNRF